MPDKHWIEYYEGKRAFDRTKRPEDKCPDTNSATSVTASTSPKKLRDREAYWAALRAIPASTWENMPPMISIPSGRTAKSPKAKP